MDSSQRANLETALYKPRPSNSFRWSQFEYLQHVLRKPKLDEFLQITSAIWQDYELHGPGKLDLQRYQAVDRLALSLREEVRQDSAWLVEDTRQLAQICLCSPQGFSFLSGEAELVPRHDLYVKFHQRLPQLKIYCERLEDP